MKPKMMICLLYWASLLVFSSEAKKTHVIHWNSTNPMFRIDNTDNVIDVNKNNNKYEYDQVNIFCPHYDESHPGEKETYIIYIVSKEEYDTCRLLSSKPQIVATCNTPEKPKFITLTFRSFSPKPGGLEFISGKDYYIISTSSRKNLFQKSEGKCLSHNMKVIFKVAPKFPDASDESGLKAVVPSLKPDETRKRFRQKMYEDFIKKGGYSENSVFKQEASRMPSSSSSIIVSMFSVFSLLLVLLLL